MSMVQQQQQSICTPRVLLGTNSLYYWYKNDLLCRLLDRWIVQKPGTPTAIDGFELFVSQSDLIQWVSELERGKETLPGQLGFLSKTAQKKVLREYFLSAHLFGLKELFPGSEVVFGELLSIIKEATGISVFTVHPDDCSPDRIKEILSHVPEGILVSLENMDKRKSSFQSLESFEQILLTCPQAMLTFDVNHWAEMGQSEVDLQLLHFLREHQDRIATIHYSAHQTELPVYRCDPQIQTSHYLVKDSGVDFSRVFFSNCPAQVSWVIEGVVPVGRLDLIKEEAELLRSCIPQIKEVRQQVVNS